MKDLAADRASDPRRNDLIAMYCPYCEGTGTDPDSCVTCPRCNGTATVLDFA
jgi:hypothetical protein